MAKLKDKLYNRVIEGELKLNASEQAEQDASAIKAVESASSGTINKVLGLSSQGKLVKGDVSTPHLYKHNITIEYVDEEQTTHSYHMVYVNKSSTSKTGTLTSDILNEHFPLDEAFIATIDNPVSGYPANILSFNDDGDSAYIIYTHLDSQGMPEIYAVFLSSEFVNIMVSDTVSVYL